MAVEGKIDFARKTNPFGSGEETEDEKLAKQVAAPELAAEQLMAFVKRKQAHDGRHAKKKNL